jgi:hypothetical protein
MCPYWLHGQPAPHGGSRVAIFVATSALSSAEASSFGEHPHIGVRLEHAGDFKEVTVLVTWCDDAH